MKAFLATAAGIALVFTAIVDDRYEGSRDFGRSKGGRLLYI